MEQYNLNLETGEYTKIKIDDINIPKNVILKELKEKKLRDIIIYDSSEKVNCFILHGKLLWLSWDVRLKLTNSIKYLLSLGQSTTTLWYNGQCFQLKIELALLMLAELELYALKCYNVTQLHLANVNNLTTIKEVEEYNYKVNYPEKLNFNIK